MKRVIVGFLFAAVVMQAEGQASSRTGSFVPGTPADEAAIRAIVADDSSDSQNPHEAADLDWENAFGIRFYDLKKRNAWYNEGVKPQFAKATTTVLEVDVRFFEPTAAVADQYWHVVGQIYAGETKPGADRWGRTTFVFKKINGEWIEVVQRVADIRAPYFKHYAELPKAVPVPAATLASYVGTYVGKSGKEAGRIMMNGGQLTSSYGKDGPYVLIATSATEFLEFKPDMVARYQKLSFSTLADGTISVDYANNFGESLGSATKAK